MTEQFRPSVNPSLSYTGTTGASVPAGGAVAETSPLSAVVAEAVVFLSNNEPRQSPPSPPSDIMRTDSAVVFNAVFRLLDSMTSRRFTHAYPGNIALSEGEVSHISSDDQEPSALDDLDYEFQLADPETLRPQSQAVLPDGTFIAFAQVAASGCRFTSTTTSGGGDTRDDPGGGISFWEKILSYVPLRLSLPHVVQTSNTRSPHSNGTASAVNADLLMGYDGDIKPRQFHDCRGARRISQYGLRGPITQVTKNFQGYSWNSLDDYRRDQRLRRRSLQSQLLRTCQFLDRHERCPTNPFTDDIVARLLGRSENDEMAEPTAWSDDQVTYSPTDLDIRRTKRNIWFKLYGITPNSRVFFRLHYFHNLPEPVYDHFQLKNLLSLGDLPIVYYLGHVTMGDDRESVFSCLMSYNLRTAQIRRVLGPWSFGQARSLFANNIYHSFSSISFESRYLFSLSISEHYIATSDTSSSILLARRPTDDESNDPEDVGGPTTLRGTGVLCQRVSSQPLQIINSIVLIENDTESDDGQDMVALVIKQAEKKGTLIFQATVNALEALCQRVEPKIQVARAWSRMKHEHENRALRRLRTFYTNNLTSGISISPVSQQDWPSASPEATYVPTPGHLNVLTAGNDKTLCEYTLEQTLCTNQTHVQLDNCEQVCKTRRGAVSGFSACVKNQETGVRVTSSLRQVKSWSFPFCLNKIALHPRKNLILLVGDSPFVLIAARSNPPPTSYFARRGNIKHALFTLDLHQDASFAAAWHPNGYVFATGSDDRTVAIWDLRNLMSPVCVLKTEVTACRFLEFSSDGKYLLSCESEDAVVIYSVVDQFRLAQKIPFFGGCTGAGFSSDCRRIIIGIGAAGSAGGILELVINKIPFHAVRFTREPESE